jgi:trk system potassium uptake protein TrkA
VDLLKLSLPADTPLDGLTVMDFAKQGRKGTLISALSRNGEVIIPDGRTKIQAGDDMYVITPPAQIHKLLASAGIVSKPVRNVIIAGGGTTAYYLAKRLERDQIDVKIIEMDKKRAEELSDLLPECIIINGDASDRQLLMEEGLLNSDGLVSLTNLDEENMVLSMFANKVGHAKTITKLNHISFDEVVSDLPLGSIVSPKDAIAKMILQYVRAMQNTFGSNVETLTRILDDKAEVLEFAIRQ